MAGNRKFHNKFHSANHHTLPSPHIVDSGLDPIASHDFPFIGDFVLNGTVSASNNYLLNGIRTRTTSLDDLPHGVHPVDLGLPGDWNIFRNSTYIDGDTVITGNLSAIGELTYLNTQVHSTSANEIEVNANNSNGKSIGLKVDQHGTNDVLHVYNDNISTLLITGSADKTVLGSVKNAGGQIGINLGSLDDVVRPNQRMTIVGSVSVVGDPHEYLSQDQQADAGTTGSLYIEGGLHVNDKTFLDQVTIDTTDGKTYVSGAGTPGQENPVDVDVPILLDRTTIDTSDGDTYITGTNKVYIDTDQGLVVDTHTQLDQLTVDTTDGEMLIEGSNWMRVEVPGDFNKHVNLDSTHINTDDGNFVVSGSNKIYVDTSGGLDVDTHTQLDRLSVDTTDGKMYVKGNNIVDIESHTHLDQVTIDTTSGKTFISGNNIVDVESHTHLSQLTVDTTSGKTYISGPNVVDIDSETLLDKTTIDTEDGRALITHPSNTYSDRNPIAIDVPAELTQTTVDTTSGDFSVIGTGDFVVDHSGIFRVEAETELNKLTVDVTKGDFLIKGKSSGNIFDINVHTSINDATLSAGDVHITTGVDKNMLVDGGGRVDYKTEVFFDNEVELDKTTIDTTDGEFNVHSTDWDEGRVSWDNTQEMRVNVPSLFQSLTADTTNQETVIKGANRTLVLTPAEFHKPVLMTDTVDLTDQVTINNLKVSGFTHLDETHIDTTDGNFIVSGSGSTNIQTYTVFDDSVYIKGNLRVDGNAWLSAGYDGSIHVGDTDGDRVLFHADVDSDILPNVSDVFRLGRPSKRWLDVNSQIGTFDDVHVENILIVEGKTKLDETEIHTDDGEFIISGSNSSTFYTDVNLKNGLTLEGQLSATKGPWIFTGCELNPAYYSGDVNPVDQTSGSVDNAAFSTLPYHQFQVDCNSLFSTGLTAAGPVQIGELPDGVTDELYEPTLEVLGNIHVREGNIKLVSDIRHLEDENTLIRFKPDIIELRAGDAPLLTLTEKVSTDGRDTVEIGSQDSPSDLKLYKESSTDPAGITYNSETGETRFDGNIGVHGDNDAAAVIGEGIDVHGSVRVTETLSAKNLIVDYITVQEDSFGNIGGGGTGGGSELAPVSGVATAGGTTTEYVEGDTITYAGTPVGITFDVTEEQNTIQKLFSFTFEALSADAGLGISVGDVQTTTYQFAAKWDEYWSEAFVNDVEYGIVHTSDNPFAEVSSVVLSATQVPTNERIVKIVVKPTVDIKYFSHNVLAQVKPKRLDTVTTADFDVNGDLTVHGQISAGQGLTVDGDHLLKGEATYLSAATFEEDVTFKKNVDIKGELTIDDKSVFNDNVHVKGDLRVDGNAYLSAGAGGIINVGDTNVDNVVFHADVDSNITPNTHRAYDLGSRQSWWREGYIWDTFVDTISSPSFYTATSSCGEAFDANAWLYTENVSSVDGSDPYMDGEFIRISETSNYHKSYIPDAIYDEEEKIYDTGDTVELTYTSDRVAQITPNTITLSNTTVNDYPVGSRLLLITTYTELPENDDDKHTVGNWEYVTVESHNGDYELVLKDNIIKQYSTDNYTFIAKPPRYKKLIVEQGTTLTGPKWTGDDQVLQGVVSIIADTAEIRGIIDMSGKGYRGGNAHQTTSNGTGGRGESFHGGIWNVKSRNQVEGGGGGGVYHNTGSTDIAGGGGGGGHGTDGTDGQTGQKGYRGTVFPTVPEMDNEYETRIFMGPGGGQGGTDSGSPHDSSAARGGYGGPGGGIIILDSMYTKIESTGIIKTRGGNGYEAYDAGNAEPGNGGGGAGGTILFTGDVSNAGDITTPGGIGYKADGSGQSGGWGYHGGDGGDGRTAVQGRLVGTEPVDTALYGETIVQKVGESISNTLSATIGEEYDIDVSVKETDSPLLVIINETLVGFASAGENKFTLLAEQEYNEVILRKTTTGDTLLGVSAIHCDRNPITVFTSPVTAEHNVQINGNLDVWGFQTLSGDLEIGGDTHIRQDLDVDNNSTLHGKLNVSGAAHFDDTVTIEGRTQINNNVEITGTQDVSGTIHTADDLRVDGDTFLSGGLIVDEDAILNSNLHVKGDLRVDGNAYLSAGAGGIINVGDVDSDKVVFHADVDSNIMPDRSMEYNIGSQAKHWMTIYAHNYWAHGSADITQNLDVGGDTELTGTLTVSGTTLIDDDITITGSSSLSGTLDVDLDATLNSNLIVNSNTYLSGAATIDGDIHGHSDLTIDGNTTIGGDMSVSGRATIEGYTTVDDDLLVTGTTTISGHLEVDDHADIHGDVNMHGLTAAGHTQLQDNLDVDGDVVIDKNLSVGENTNITGELTVDDKSVFNDNVHIKGDLRVDGNAYLSAGASGSINVGDTETDIVIFNADIGSDVIPDVSDSFDLGKPDKTWNEVHWNGGSSLDSNSVYDFVNSTSGEWGYANLSAYQDNTYVLRHDQVPPLAITHVRRVTNSSLVTTLKDLVYRGDIVLVADTEDNLVAIVDHPTGEYDKDIAEYAGYERLFAPGNMVRFINGHQGPSVTLTPDDFDDTDSDHKFVDQSQIDDLHSVFTNVNVSSAARDSVYTNVQASSAARESVYSTVNSLSTEWDWTYGTVFHHHQNWEESRLTVNALSANWNSCESTVFYTSADWNDTRSSVMATSGDWNDTRNSVMAASGEWDSVYSFVNSDSATNNTQYNQTTFVNASGDSVTGDLNVIGTLSGTHAHFTTMTALSSFIDVVDIKVRELSGFDIIDGDLTVQGDISATGDIYLDKNSLIFSDGERFNSQDSKNAKSVYGSVLSTSGDWNDARTTLNASSGDWYDARTTLNASSGDWYDTRNSVIATSGDWNDARTTLNASSGDWYDARTTLNASSGDWYDARNSVIATSGDWNDARTTLNASSGDWYDTRTSMIATSGDWDDARTTLNASSGDWYDARNSVVATSGTWNSVYSHVNNTSGYGYATVGADGLLEEHLVPNLSITETYVVTYDDSVADLCSGQLQGPVDIQRGDVVIITATEQNLIAVVDQPTGVYNQGFDTFDGFSKLQTPTDYIKTINGKQGLMVTLNPDDLDDTLTAHKFVEELQKENWDSTYASVCATSAEWNSVYTSVNETSGEWDSVYSFVNSDSATNNTDYNQTTFVNASGDTITGDLIIEETLTVEGDTYLESTAHVSTLDVSGNTILNTLSVSGAAGLDSTLDAYDDSVFHKNVHIKGDLRVDGNAYLSAGPSGNINVGDTDTDNVVFRADVDSDFLADKKDTYTLGSEAKRWLATYSMSGLFDYVDIHDLDVSGVTKLTGKTAERGPGVIVRGTPTGIFDEAPYGFDDNGVPRADYMNPDVDIVGDVALHGSLSADNAHIFSLTASHFKAEYEKLTINDGDLEMLNGSIKQRGGNVLIESDLGHVDDENTYMRFQPDEITFTCHDVQMLRFQELTNGDDIITVGDASDAVDIIVQNPADSKTLYIDGDTGYIGIGTNAPVEKLHVDHGQVQFAAGDKNGAVMLTSGNTEERVDKTGSIRWNNELNRYEGYRDDTKSWVSLQSVGDTDGDTYISVDAGDYPDSDRIALYTVGCSAMTIYPNQTVAFAGDIQFDNITIYDNNSVTGPLTATTEFIYLKVNGKDRAIRLWATPEDTREDIETFHGESVTHIGDECGLGHGGQIPTQTISAHPVLNNPPTQRTDVDSDGDGIIDLLDPDDDNDGIPDYMDADHPLTDGMADADNDGIADPYDDDMFEGTHKWSGGGKAWKDITSQWETLSGNNK